MNREQPPVCDRSRAARTRACVAVVLLAGLLASCSETIVTEPENFSQVAPGAAGAESGTDTGCALIDNEQADACRIAWLCPGTGRLTFACFNEAAGRGCGCMVDEEFTTDTTMDLSACGDNAAMAALARKTCGWDVP